jgi:hypothetical protein
MFCIVFLLIAIMSWAVMGTLAYMGLYQLMSEIDAAMTHTRISFSVTPTLNPDLYKCLTQQGTEGDYECLYKLGDTMCTNKDSMVAIYFYSDGAVCSREAPGRVDGGNGLFRWDNIPSVIHGLQQQDEQESHGEDEGEWPHIT